jgi:hypothetical protein
MCIKSSNLYLAKLSPDMVVETKRTSSEDEFIICETELYNCGVFFLLRHVQAIYLA